MKVDPLKILFLEDVPEDVELVKRALTKGGIHFDLHHADSREAFINAIRTHVYDVILSDHALPQYDSTRAYELIKRAGIVVPFILVTGNVPEEYAIKCLKLGIDDYVIKSGLHRLADAITNALRKRKLESERLTAELALRSKNVELKKINAELDNFVYSISHDLRAPLMTILGVLNISQHDSHPRDPVYDQYFQMMEATVKRLDDTLKEIMEYSIVRTRDSRVSLVPINFIELIDNNLAKLKYLEGFDKILIEHHLTGVEIPFHSSAYYISLVLSNLLSNAVKYRDEGKGKCTVSIQIALTETEATIEIKDNGIGIDSEHLPKIFDMFYRGHEKLSGSGLGLHIVKQAIEKINGTIKVGSHAGVGTTTRIVLPNLVEEPYRELAKVKT